MEEHKNSVQLESLIKKIQNRFDDIHGDNT